MKPADPRVDLRADPRGSVVGFEPRQTTIIDYGCKKPPHTEISTEIPHKVMHAHLDGCVRAASLGGHRHVYESPKIMRGHGNPLDLPAFNDMDGDKEEKSGRFTD